MTGVATVYAVFGSTDEAEQIGQAMVDARLAGCGNISTPLHPLYRWRGKSEKADETAARFKTRKEPGESLIARGNLRARIAYGKPFHA